MKPDDFEKRLQSQPLREVPTEWREQILSGAQASIRNPKSETRNGFLSTFLWPNPQAWAGLAAVWVIIFVLHFASRGSSHVVVTASAPQPSNYLTTWKEQQQTLVELMDYNQPIDADRPRHIGPQPRTDLRNPFTVA